MFCNQCGHQNPEAARFCSSCGAPLEPPEPLEADEPTRVLEAVPTADDETGDVDIGTGHGMLVVRRGPNAGSRFVLEGERVRVGRAPDSEILLDDITVSRRHAEFVPRQTGGYEVRDGGSLNGTYVNRERIDAVPLSNGDEVQIGKFKLVYLTSV